MRRILRTLVFFVGLAILFMPAAAAQPKPLVTVKIKWAMDHEMTLSDDGRGDMGTVVEVFGEDFVCAQPLKFKVELGIKDLPKVYGSSMVPKVVPTGNAYFVFDQGKVGLKPASAGERAANSPNDEGKLNMAWDVEGAHNAEPSFEYVVQGSVKMEGSGSCSPTPVFHVVESPPMRVLLPERVVADETDDSTRCMENPALCQTQRVPEEPIDTPSLGGLAALFALLASLLWARQRRD